MAAITVDGLSKSFLVRPARGGGWRGLGRLRPATAPARIAAVEALSFAVEPGERVAFIGPNGAGKSTTLKMLTGILYPTAGHAEVMGYVPWRQRRQLAREIGIVFGQRSQLWHHLPVRRSLELLCRVYDIDAARYRAQLGRLAEGFAIADLLDRPVAQLSLGQRLRCEIAAALLHRPRLLLLDEPTIGLDVTAKAMQCVVFWVPGAVALSEELFNTFLMVTFYPQHPFSFAVRLVLFTVFPTAFVALLPVLAIRDLDPMKVLGLLAAAVVYAGIALLIFERGLRRYASGNRMIELR